LKTRTEGIGSGSEERTLTIADVKSWRVQRAYATGYIEPGYRVSDYMAAAIHSHGWWNMPIWGEKGSGKSNRMLKFLYRIYGNWDAVHRHVVYEPTELGNMMADAAQKEERIPAIGFDDINAFFPRTLYFTKRSIFQQLQSAWNLSRTVLSCFISTMPTKEDLVSFVLKDLSAEVHTFSRGAQWRRGEGSYEFIRWVTDIDVKDYKHTTRLPVKIYERTFRLDEVPKEQWRRYWKRKLEIGKVGTEEWSKALKELNTGFEEVRAHLRARQAMYLREAKI
jgi:hypothetical protein